MNIFWGVSLYQGTIIDTVLINAPSSCKDNYGKCDPEIHQTKKDQHYYFVMKAHIVVGVESGLVVRVVDTVANEADVIKVNKLLHGAEKYSRCRCW